MDEIYIKITDLRNNDLDYLADYFKDKDMVCLIDILGEFDYILEKQHLKETIWDELDNQFAESERQREEHEIDEHYS